jgi:hypothetical protein
MLQDILAVFAIIQFIAQVPLWRWIFTVRDGLAASATLKDDFEKFKIEVRGKLKEIEEDHHNLYENVQQLSMKSLEVMGSINIAITKLDASVNALNKTVEKSEGNLTEMVKRVYKELDDHKTQTTQLISKLIESNGTI